MGRQRRRSSFLLKTAFWFRFDRSFRLGVSGDRSAASGRTYQIRSFRMAGAVSRWYWRCPSRITPRDGRGNLEIGLRLLKGGGTTQPVTDFIAGFETVTLVLEWNGSPREYKVRIMDSTSVKSDNRVSPNGNLRWRDDLDNRPLVFRNNFRPGPRYLYFHYCLQILRRAWKDPPYQTKVTLKNEISKLYWGTPGRYLLRNMLLAFVEELAAVREMTIFFLEQHQRRLRRGIRWKWMVMRMGITGITRMKQTRKKAACGWMLILFPDRGPIL